MGYATKKQLDYAQQIATSLGLKVPEQRDFDTINNFIANNRQDFYQVKNQQMREAIVANVSILSIAEELGLTPVRKGHYYSLKEHDSVRIDPQKNCYWRNSVSMGGRSSQSGSVIDFMRNFSGRSMGEVMKDLSERVKDTHYEPVSKEMSRISKQPKEHGELILPESSYNMRRVYAYLAKTRMIDPDIIQDFVDRKMLYQDTYGNCVFVSRDENSQPIFACKRGTNTERRFLADVSNSDYSKGFYINNHADKVVVTESVIDAMSVMQILDSKGMDYKSFNYLPLAGATKFESLINQVRERSEVREVYLALDNDKAGRENMEEIKKLISEHLSGDRELQVHECLPEYAKDWNEEIKYAFSHQIECKELDFFNEKTEGHEAHGAHRADNEQRQEMEPAMKKSMNMPYVLDEGLDY